MKLCITCEKLVFNYLSAKRATKAPSGQSFILSEIFCDTHNPLRQFQK